MKIKSISDVITNSSDEVYIIKTDKTAQEILDELLSIKDPKEGCSGMGGILNVETHDDYVGNDLNYAHENIKIPKGFAFATIDNGYTKLHDYLRPLHCNYVQEIMDISYCFKYDIEYLKDKKITSEMSKIIPDLKDDIKKCIEIMTKLYENTFNN